MTMFMFIFLITECLFLIMVRPGLGKKINFDIFIWMKYFSLREYWKEMTQEDRERKILKIMDLNSTLQAEKG